MRLCRFGDSRLGIVEGSTVRDVTAALDILPACKYPLPRHDLLIAHLDQVIQRACAMAVGAPAIQLNGLKLLSPVANPGKIIAAPVNYQKHLSEVKDDEQFHHGNAAHMIKIHDAGLFLKATSALVGPGEGIPWRKPGRRNDHEVELAVTIGKTASNVSRKD